MKTVMKFLPRRFSLRALCVGCLIVGTATGWVAKNYNERLAEERWIDQYVKSNKRTSVVAADTRLNVNPFGMLLM